LLDQSLPSNMKGLGISGGVAREGLGNPPKQGGGGGKPKTEKKCGHQILSPGVQVPLARKTDVGKKLTRVKGKKSGKTIVPMRKALDHTT